MATSSCESTNEDFTPLPERCEITERIRQCTFELNIRRSIRIVYGMQTSLDILDDLIMDLYMDQQWQDQDINEDRHSLRSRIINLRWKLIRKLEPHVQHLHYPRTEERDSLTISTNGR